MGTPVKFDGANGELRRPPSMTEEQCGPLPVFRNGMVCVSRWQLTREELAEVSSTGCVYLSVFSGVTQPPVFIGSEETLREACADLGPLWNKPLPPVCRAETSVCDINGDCLRCGAAEGEHCKDGDVWHQPFRGHDHG